MHCAVFFSICVMMHCKCVCPPLCPAVVMVCLLRYAQVIEHSHRCWVNTSALVSGCTNAVGLVMVGNFQVNTNTLNSKFGDLLLLFFALRWVDTADCAVLFVRLITPNLYTMWVPVWHFQQGCCLYACSVCSPTGWLWPPSTTGWPILEWLWHWEPWFPSSSVSFTY